MRKICPEDLTVKQIRYLILEKRRAVRDTRLEHFYRTGRVIPFVGERNTIEDFGIGASFERAKVKDEKGSQRTWLISCLKFKVYLMIYNLYALVCCCL